MNKYLATDLDGTLLEPRSVKTYVCNENTETIKLFNGNVFIISGRSQQFIKEVCKELNINETFVGCNGAIIYVNGQKIFTSYIDNTIIKEIIEYVKKYYHDYHIIFIDDNGDLYSIYDNEKRVLQAEKRVLSSYPKLAYKTDKDSTHLYNLLEGKNKIIKLNLNIDSIHKKEILKYLNDRGYNISISICNNSLEITSKDINKGSSLKILTDTLNIDTKDVYVIGDDGNDVSMFNFYQNSFLIKNDNNSHLIGMAKHALNTFRELENYMEE